MAEITRAVFRNPGRSEGQLFTEAELEVERLQEKGVKQNRIVYQPVVYEYWAPFNYDNIKVELGRTDPYIGAEYNPDGVELDVPPYGAITVVEDEPIIAVTVIGSACVAPGFVLIQAEPVEWKFPRTGVKMKVDGLWGEHIRIEPWKRGVHEGWSYAGLSSAHFELPESKKVTIMAGSSMDIAEIDVKNMRHDAHYAVRIIRVTVKRPVS